MSGGEGDDWDDWADDIPLSQCDNAAKKSDPLPMKPKGGKKKTNSEDHSKTASDRPATGGGEEGGVAPRRVQHGGTSPAAMTGTARVDGESEGGDVKVDGSEDFMEEIIETEEDFQL